MSILQVPHEKLDVVCKDIEKFDEPLEQEMLDVLRKHGGLGIAANQLGSDSRMCIVVDPETRNALMLVNPRIVWKSPTKFDANEGCLSIAYGRPRFLVCRSKHVRVEAQDKHLEKFQIEAGGYFAAVLQHEIGHLDGKTIANARRAA